MRRLSDTTEEVVFGKTKEVLEEIERITRGEGGGETQLSILHTRQLALLTVASLKISKSLSAIRGVIARKI